MTDQELAWSRAIRTALATTKPKMSVERLAGLMPVSVNRLAHIAQERTPARLEEMERVRQILGLPKGWPRTETPEEPSPGERVSLSGTPLVDIPVYGEVSAGPGNWRVDPERKTVAVPENLARIAPIGLIVDGDSMMPMLHEGDTACFAERHRPRHGYSFLINIPEHGDRVKLMVFDRGDWYMTSLNPKYPRELMPSGTEIVGLLMGFYRAEGTQETVVANPEGLLPPQT